MLLWRQQNFKTQTYDGRKNLLYYMFQKWMTFTFARIFMSKQSFPFEKKHFKLVEIYPIDPVLERVDCIQI